MYNFQTQIDLDLMNHSDRDPDAHLEGWSLSSCFPKKELAVVGIISASVLGAFQLPKVERQDALGEIQRNAQIENRAPTLPLGLDSDQR